MKVLIVGSRSIDEFELSGIVPKKAELIISGGAEGIDSIAEKYADQNRISKLILRPKYEKYGKAAPLKRNEAMVDIADVVLIIWDGVSRGAMHTLKYAQKRRKNIILIKTNDIKLSADKQLIDIPREAFTFEK